MNKQTLLIVDNQPDNRARIAVVVSERLPDVAVICANDAVEALALIARQPPDAILLDVQMPGMNGIEMCRKLKADPATAHIPVILITAQKTKGCERRRGLDAGADDFLNKPMDNDELVARIRVALRVKKAEDGLRQSSEPQRQWANDREAPSKTILQIAMDGCWQADIQGRLKEVNENYCRMSGYNRDELLTLAIPQLEAVESPTEVAAHREKMKSGGVVHFESRHRRKDGSVYDVEISAKYVHLGDSERTVAFLRDITDRKRAEEALRESEEKYKALIETTNTGYVILDQCGTVMDANQEYVRLTGHQRLDEILGRTVTEWTAKHDLARNAAEVRRCLEQGAVRHLEIDYVDNTGRITPVELNATVLRNGEAVRILTVCRDMTERRKAKAALDESEARFSNAFRVSPVAVAITALRDGRYIEVNDVGARMFGYERSEVVGRTPQELGIYLDPAERDKMVESLRRDGRVVNRPMLLRAKSGEIRRVEFSAVPIQVLGAECLLVAAHDVTVRERAEAALRENEDRLRRILDHAPISMAIVGMDGAIEYINRKAIETFGYLPEDIPTMDRWWVQAYPDEDYRREVIANWTGLVEAAMAEHHEIEGGEYRVTCKDGIVKTVLIFGVPVANKLFVMFDDITARKRAEEALRNSEQQYRTTIDSMSDLIHVVDPGLRVVLANRTFGEWLRRLGLETPPLGRTIFEVFPFLPETVRGEYQRVFATGEPLITEDCTIVGGRDFVTETRKIPIIEGGKVVRVVTVIRDVTQAKLDHERLRQAEKMAALGQLAGGIAHDFNNQLAAMLGYAELLGARLADEELRLFANMIARAAMRSGDMTRQLLAFARKGKYQSMPVEIHSLINEVAMLLTRTVDKHIIVKQMLSANPSTTKGDPIQLQNALLNLAINARDAMPDGGELIFATDVVVLDEEYCRIAPQPITPGKYIEISVTDTGVGMSEETQKRLFEPFFTTKEPGKGTGMGLAAVYGTVANHQGTISFRSELGRGTTFTLQLPLLESAPAMETAVGVEGIVTGTAHILLADDEKIVREMIAAGLRHLGYRVTTCEDGAEAVTRYSDVWREIDLVMLDMVMPKLGGRDALLAMRKVNPAVRALLSSGYSIDGRVQKLVEGGGVYFVQKPFHLGDLSKAVAAALRR